jgi:hypothetical protein
MKKASLPPLTANLAAAILGIWKLKSRAMISFLADLRYALRQHFDFFQQLKISRQDLPD